MSTPHGWLDRLRVAGSRARPSRRWYRLAWFAVAVFSVTVGLGAWLVLAPLDWAIDARRLFDVSAELIRGSYGANREDLYTPLAALVTEPFTLFPAEVASLAWLGLKLGVLALGTWRAARSVSNLERFAVFGVAALFVPIVHDLVIGNTSVFVAAAIAVLAWGEDRPVSGLPLGLLMATVPKPLLVPVLAWAILRRPRALLAAGVIALALTLLGIAALGADRYASYFGLLMSATGRLSGAFPGNVGPGAVVPALALPLALGALIVTLVAAQRDSGAGFVCAVAAGLWMPPYTMVYSAAALLVGLPIVARRVPRLAVILAAVAPVAVIVALPAFAGAILLLGAWLALARPENATSSLFAMPFSA